MERAPRREEAGYKGEVSTTGPLLSWPGLHRPHMPQFQLPSETRGTREPQASAGPDGQGDGRQILWGRFGTSEELPPEDRKGPPRKKDTRGGRRVFGKQNRSGC